MNYNIIQPVNTLLNCIEDLSNVANHAMLPFPMSEQQIMIDLAYVIFAKCPLLQPDFRLWNRRLAVEGTYANLTQHLRDAQSDISSLPTATNVYHQQLTHRVAISCSSVTI